MSGELLLKRKKKDYLLTDVRGGREQEPPVEEVKSSRMTS